MVAISAAIQHFDQESEPEVRNRISGTSVVLGKRLASFYAQIVAASGEMSQRENVPYKLCPAYV